jgi:NADPH:quinone reductase-like Zn-dependent oxidoreductase
MTTEESHVNIAATVPVKFAQIEVAEVEKWTPGQDEVVIKTFAVATNPLDYMIQKMGFEGDHISVKMRLRFPAMFKTPYPVILGTDVAGVVEEVGEGVTKLKKGDRVGDVQCRHCTSTDVDMYRSGLFYLILPDRTESTAHSRTIVLQIVT